MKAFQTRWIIENAKPTARAIEQAPVRRIPRRRLQRQANRLGDRVIANLPRRVGTRLVEKAIEAMLSESAAPFAHRVGGRANAQAVSLFSKPDYAESIVGIAWPPFDCALSTWKAVQI